MRSEEIKDRKKSEEEIDTHYFFGDKSYKGKKRIEIPVKFGKRNVLFETEILEGDIPWLIGTNVMSKLGR